MSKTWKPEPGETLGEVIARAWREVQAAENEKLAARLQAEGFTPEEIEQALADGRAFVREQLTGGASIN